MLLESFWFFTSKGYWEEKRRLKKSRKRTAIEKGQQVKADNGLLEIVGGW